MNDRWVPIRYRDFYDFPRAFVVERAGHLLFFDCPFDDAMDEYESSFAVFKIKDEFREKVDQSSWQDLRNHADYLGSVPIEAVNFDETRRRAISTEVFELLER